MANKRVFKKYVHEVTGAVVNDMMGATYLFDKVDKDKIDKAIIDLLADSEAAIVKLNVKYDKTLKAFGNAKEYRKAKRNFYKDLYTKINGEFAKAVEKALQEFNSSFPEELKASLKSEAAK